MAPRGCVASSVSTQDDHRSGSPRLPQTAQLAFGT